MIGVQSTEYKLEKRSVNNKALFNEIHKFIDDGIVTGGILWSNDIHRQSFVDVVCDCLEQAEHEGFIDQWNVFSDFRNNSLASMNKGVYVVEVAYRQINCLNTTRLIYTITDSLLKNLSDLIEFQLTP
jgi:hypothetical protein